MKRRREELERAAAGLPVAEATPAERIADVRTLLETFLARLEALADAGQIARRTAELARGRAPHLERLLGSHLRAEVTEGAVLGYIAARKREGAGPRTINMEIDHLARALGGTWRGLWPRVPHLKEPRDAGRALSREEQHRLLAAAATNRSPYILLALRLALQTGMRFDEIRHLTWGSIDGARGVITVPKSKTPAGERRIVPLTDGLRRAIEEYRAWYVAKLGKTRPDWFLFPFTRVILPADPERPCTTLKHAWESTRRAAGVKCRFHDLRHSAITRMLEAGAPEHAVRAIVGHVSPKMLERYAHMRLEVKRQAVQALELPELEAPATISTTVSPNSRPS
jgi:integrase